MKKALIEKRETIIDVNTGEVLEHKEFTKQQVKNSYEPDFVKLYIRDIINLASVDIKTARVDILYILLSYLDYHNEILLNHQRRIDICEACGISNDYFNKVLKDFLENQILLPCYNKQGEKVRGTYIANPHFFGRGKWEDIYNLRLSITYDQSAKRFIQLERNPNQQISMDIVAPTICDGVELYNN